MKLTLHDIHLFSRIKFYSSSDISFILVSQSKKKKKKKVARVLRCHLN